MGYLKQLAVFDLSSNKLRGNILYINLSKGPKHQTALELEPNLSQLYSLAHRLLELVNGTFFRKVINYFLKNILVNI